MKNFSKNLIPKKVNWFSKMDKLDLVHFSIGGRNVGKKVVLTESVTKLFFSKSGKA
jgi:hypothetical protein